MKDVAEEILKDCDRYFIEGKSNSQETVIALEDAIEAVNKFLGNEYNIETHVISTSLGKSDNKLKFLTDLEQEEFDNIGYTGSDFNGYKSNYQLYLNSLGKGKFVVRQTMFDNGDSKESFLITRVTK